MDQQRVRPTARTSRSSDPDTIAQVSITQRRWRRFKRMPTAIASSLILVAFVLMAVFAPALAPTHPDQGNIRDRLQPPSAEYLLGTDQQGRDMLSRVIFGSRVALIVGSLTIAIGLSIGGVLGTIAGYYRGWLDSIIMRTMDLLLAFPYILLVVVIVTMLGPNLQNAIIAIGVTNVPHFARIVRSVVIAIREKEFVTAAGALGASQVRTIARHVMPNAIAPIIVVATLYFGRNVIAEATLSFLGLGVQPPTAAWGSMVSVGREYLRSSPHLSLAPGIALMFFVYALNTLGDALRDVLDPKTQ